MYSYGVYVGVEKIDGLHLTPRQSCWRSNTKEYVTSSIVGSNRRACVADTVWRVQRDYLQTKNRCISLRDDSSEFKIGLEF